MSKPPATVKTYTRYQALEHLPVQDVLEMFKVFSRYYDHVAMDQFLSDLSRKSGAFVVRRQHDNAIVGFSTFGVYHLEVDGRRIKGVFSGDTVLEKEHWGNRAINAAFVRRVLWEAIKNPLTPQYWFLISKGYKTFLLLSRNFPEYYPHPRQPHEHLRHIAQAYCEQLFPGKLDRASMVLDFGQGYNCLKSDITPITASLRQQADIAFFERCNPNWERGTELPCVGRADLRTFFQVIVPQMWKLLTRPSRSGAKTSAGARSARQVWADSSFGRAVARHRTAQPSSEAD